MPVKHQSKTQSNIQTKTESKIQDKTESRAKDKTQANPTEKTAPVKVKKNTPKEKKLTNSTSLATASRYIPKKVRSAVWEEAQGRCAICGSTDFLELDHIKPFALGGDSGQ